MKQTFILIRKAGNAGCDVEDLIPAFETLTRKDDNHKNNYNFKNMMLIML